MDFYASGEPIISDEAEQVNAGTAIHDDDDDIDASGNTAEVEVLVRRDPADSFSVVSFQMSRHDARWLVDGLGITE